jgi:hypothetical protein
MGADVWLPPKLHTSRLGRCAKPDFTRSRMRSRSNSARPAMIVCMSLPLAVLRSKLNPVCANTLTFQPWRSSISWEPTPTAGGTAVAVLKRVK